MEWPVVAAVAAGLLLVALATAAASVYRVARADEAFVRTGLGGPLVVLDTGVFVLPVVHRTIAVSLRIMDIEVVAPAHRPDGDDPGDVVARIHTRVNANPGDIIRATRGFAGEAVAVDAVTRLLADLVGGAVQAATAADPLSLGENWQKTATNVEAGVLEALAARGMSVELLTLTRRQRTAVAGGG